MDHKIPCDTKTTVLSNGRLTIVPLITIIQISSKLLAFGILTLAENLNNQLCIFFLKICSKQFGDCKVHLLIKRRRIKTTENPIK